MAHCRCTNIRWEVIFVRVAIFVTATLYIASLLSPLPLMAAEEKGDARQLFENKCSICHSILFILMGIRRASALTHIFSLASLLF